MGALQHLQINVGQRQLRVKYLLLALEDLSAGRCIVQDLLWLAFCDLKHIKGSKCNNNTVALHRRGS